MRNSTDCRVSLTVVPPYLLAADNMNCGGMNVSFTGCIARNRGYVIDQYAAQASQSQLANPCRQGQQLCLFQRAQIRRPID
jgi:hypothetical protein